MIRIHVTCDGCGETADLFEQRIGEARAELYGEGWRSVRAGAKEPLEDYCPDCAARRVRRENAIGRRVWAGPSRSM